MSTIEYTRADAAAEVNANAESRWMTVFQITDPAGKQAAIESLSKSLTDETEALVAKHKADADAALGAVKQTEDAFKAKVVEAVGPAMTDALKKELLRVAAISGNVRGLTVHFPIEEIETEAQADSEDGKVRKGDKSVTGHKVGATTTYFLTKRVSLGGGGNQGGGAVEMRITLKGETSPTVFKSAAQAIRKLTDSDGKNISRATIAARLKALGHTVHNG